MATIELESIVKTFGVSGFKTGCLALSISIVIQQIASPTYQTKYYY